MRKNGFSFLCGLLLALLTAATAAAAAETAQPAVPVVFAEQTILEIEYGSGVYNERERAQIIESRLLAASRLAGNIRQVQQGERIDIYWGQQVIVSVLPEDAHLAGMSQEALANVWSEQIGKVLKQYRYERQWQQLGSNGVISLGLTLGLWMWLRLLRWVKRRLHQLLGRYTAQGLRWQKVTLLSEEQIQVGISVIWRVLQLALTVAACYLYVYAVLRTWPWTRSYADQLLEYVLQPLAQIAMVGWELLPNLLIILITIAISRYVLLGVRFLLEQVRRGNIHWAGFYPEWIEPTYKIVRFVVWVLTLIAIFPYIPGAQSPMFQGVSVLLGIMVSLGSSSVIANAIAGFVMIYTRAFQLGDLIQVGEQRGVVLETSMFATRIQTFKNEIITLPNSLVLGSHVMNYSELARREGLIIHATVTIGYDVPWQQVQALLLAAAARCSLLMAAPPPFVLQTALNDFNVAYEINAYSREAERLPAVYSELYTQIQACFQEAGVEIMSPQYTALRDGNAVTLPPEHLPEGYQPACHRVEHRK